MGISAGPDIITDGLVLELDAGDRNSYPGTGTTWRDLSGNSNNGTLINGPTFNTGSLGNIVFDGVDDYTSFSINPTLTNQVTFELWIRPDSSNVTGGGGSVASYVFGREGNYRLILGTGGTFSWICATTNNSWYSTGTAIGSANTYNLQWIQVDCVYDSTKLLLYVNSNLIVTGSAISGNISTSNPSAFQFMQASGGNITYGKGNLSNFKTYNRALSAAEVSQNYTAMKTRFGL